MNEFEDVQKLGKDYYEIYAIPDCIVDRFHNITEDIIVRNGQLISIVEDRYIAEAVCKNHKNFYYLTRTAELPGRIYVNMSEFLNK